jgi:hypothetical protein
MLRRVLIAVFALLMASPLWAQTSCGVLSNCPNASTPLSGTELLYIIQQGVSKKTTVGSLTQGTVPLTIGMPILGAINGYYLYNNNGQLGDIAPSLFSVLNVAGGGTVNTPVPPLNINVFAQGAITQWNVDLPTTPFDGEMVGVGCPGGAVTTITIVAPVTITPGGPTTCNLSAGPFAWYQFSQQENEWILIFNVANTGGGGSVLSGRTPLINGIAVVTGAFTGTCVVQDVTNPANTSWGVEAPTSLSLHGTGTDVIKWICS